MCFSNGRQKGQPVDAQRSVHVGGVDDMHFYIDICRQYIYIYIFFWGGGRGVAQL